MQHPRKFLLTLLTVALILPAIAWGAPQVKIAVKAEKEVVIEEGGKTVIKRVPAAEAAPGETIIYTLEVANTGDEAATDVVVNNPIPKGTAYVPGSATETGEVTFSIDKGVTYKRPSLLTYEVTSLDGSKAKRTASPEQYTDIRWQIPLVSAGASQKMSFQVKVQ